jgi:hypothetical protein
MVFPRSNLGRFGCGSRQGGLAREAGVERPCTVQGRPDSTCPSKPLWFFAGHPVWACHAAFVNASSSPDLFDAMCHGVQEISQTVDDLVGRSFPRIAQRVRGATANMRRSSATWRWRHQSAWTRSVGGVGVPAHGCQRGGSWRARAWTGAEFDQPSQIHGARRAALYTYPSSKPPSRTPPGPWAA